jgi:ABC-type uncharacterized transport system involved in gliding motility auxiliary subunit
MANEDSEKQNPTPEEAPRHRGFRTARKFAISLNTLAVIVLAAAIVGMINYLSIRHYKRMDWTKAQYFSISDKTAEIVKSLKEPMRCIVFFQPTQEIFDDVRNLLREYEDLNPKNFTIEYVDPDRNFARVEQLVKEYDINTPNGVIFVRGEGTNKKSKYVNVSEIVEMDYGGGMFGGPPRKKAFKGEQAFTSAIQNVLESKQPTVWFLTGHGEHDPEDFDERRGYSSLATALKRENLKVATINLATTNAIPSEDSVLVIAGPTVPISKPELAIIEQYVQNKGRVLVMLDAHKNSGLEELLARWGVKANNDTVVGIVSVLGISSQLSASAIAFEYSGHPIVQKMKGKNTSFPLSRSLEVVEQPPRGAPDLPRATWLARSHKAFWGESDLSNTDDIQFDEKTDKAGPLILAAAVESGNVPGTGVDLPSTRMVVTGSSGFVANAAMDESNLDLFLNMVTWLIGEREGRVTGISPKAPREFRLSLDEVQEQTLRLFVVFGMPGVVAVAGIVVWWRRRK